MRDHLSIVSGMVADELLQARSAPRANEVGAGEAGAFRLSRLASLFKEPAGQSWCRQSTSFPAAQGLDLQRQYAYITSDASSLSSVLKGKTLGRGRSRAGIAIV